MAVSVIENSVHLSSSYHGTEITLTSGIINYDYVTCGPITFVSGTFVPSSDLPASTYIDFDLPDLPNAITGAVGTSVSTISSSDRTPMTQIQAIGAKRFRLSGAQTSGRAGQFYLVCV